jgi:hypothetical protein
MKCKIDITAATDLSVWVTRHAFTANVDPEDLACRESKEVFDWYHPGWFRHDAIGDLRFTPPAFIFSRGHLRGINGRHRAVLLFRHLEVIPMLLVHPEDWPMGKVKEIAHQEIGEDEIIELPDLCINHALQKVDEQEIQSAVDVSEKVNVEIKINL